jgi:dienelactone hydrolase
VTSVAAVVVVAVGLVLIAFAGLAFIKPARAGGFLMAFASSARTHYIEQAFRIAFGTAVVILSSIMWQPKVFWLFGWAIVGSSATLLCIPWQWHDRLGGRLRPMLVKYLKLYAAGAFALGVLLLYGVLAGRAFGAVIGPTTNKSTVFINVVANGRVEAQLETQVYFPQATGHRPVVILNHGSAGASPKQSIDWSGEAAYFTSKGYVVLAPMRRGRGNSSGISLESEEKNCDLSSWAPGILSASSDLDAVIEYAQSMTAVDATDITMVGMSRGGFLSIAYAAEGLHKAQVRSVVNFVGGWVAQAEDQCPNDFNALSFAKYGAETHVPTLWLYGARDLFYGDDAVKAYAEAFRAAGGTLELHIVEGVPQNGHWLPRYMDRWRPLVDPFLAPPNTLLGRTRRR